MFVDASMSGRLVELAVGEILEIRLAENRTTGYQWSFVEDGTPVCSRVSDEYQVAAGPPGQGGSHRWELRAVEAGEAQVSLEYRRPWEHDVAPTGTFSIRLRVSPSA